MKEEKTIKREQEQINNQKKQHQKKKKGRYKEYDHNGFVTEEQDRYCSICTAKNCDDCY